MSLKIDMHVHTIYSYDACITPKELAAYSRNRGLDGVAITDHGTVNGLAEFGKIRNLLIIPGLEVSTAQGHVLAINISQVVKHGLSFAETVDQIHKAGGLAIIAHPTAFFKGISQRELNQSFDAMEVINSSAIPFSFSVRKNKKIAAELNLPQTAGSDAHYAPEIGMAYTIIESKRSVESVIDAIKKGALKPVGRSTPWGMRLKKYLRMRTLREERFGES